MFETTNLMSKVYGSLSKPQEYYESLIENIPTLHNKQKCSGIKKNIDEHYAQSTIIATSNWSIFVSLSNSDSELLNDC